MANQLKLSPEAIEELRANVDFIGLARTCETPSEGVTLLDDRGRRAIVAGYRSLERALETTTRLQLELKELKAKHDQLRQSPGRPPVEDPKPKTVAQRRWRSKKAGKENG